MLGIAPFVFLSVLSSEVLTSLMSLMFHGRVLPDYLVTGGVVSGIASAVVVYLIRRRDITESRLRERNLILMSFALDHVDVAAFLSDEEARIRYANEAACSALGYSREELLGMRVSEIDPDYRMEDWPGHWRELKTQGSLNFESRHRTSDGRVFPVEVSANYFEYEGRGFNLGLARDITERRQREERQKRVHEGLLKLGHDYHRNINLLTSLCGEILGADCALYSRLDRALLCVKGQWCAPPDLKLEDDPRGHLCFDVIQGAADQPLVIRNLQDTVYAETDPNVAAYRLRTYVGYPVSFAGKPIGSLCAVYTSDRELSRDDLHLIGTLAAAIGQEEERAAGAEALRLKNSVFDASLAANSTAGPDGRLNEVNPAFLSVWGYDRREDVLGRPIADFFQRPDDAAVVLKALDSTGRWEGDFSAKRRDGSIFTAHGLATVLRDEAGGLVGYQSAVLDISERRRTEEKLRESEKRFLQVAAQAREWIWEVDMDGRYTYASDAVRDILGYAPNEVVGKKHFYDLFYPEDREDLKKAAFAVFAEKQPFNSFVNRNVHRDGRTVWLSTSGVPILDAEGRLLGYRGTDADITDRKLAEESIRRSNQRFEDIVAATGQYAWEVDRDYRTTYVSGRVFDILGYTPDELIGKTPLEFSPSGEAERLRLVLASKSEKLQPIQDIEQYAVGKDGEGRWLRVFGMPVVEDGVFCGYRGTALDITPLKKAESFVRDILDTVDEGFIVIDRDYRILTANRAYCAQAGMTCDDVIGRHCYEITHKAGRPCYEEGEECAVQRVFETGEPHTVVHRHADPAGNVIFEETKAFPIRDAAGNVATVIETINDITEKQLLQEERLRAQKLESIGTLVGGIAHDFNNLLQGVFGYISLARMSAGDPERVREMLKQAEAALHLSVNLTSQLLTFSKGGKPVKKLIRLQPVMENSVRFALSGSHTDYHLETAPGLWTVEADEGQLAQVIQNIALNSSEAMAGRGTVKVRADNAGIPAGLKSGLPGGGRFVRIEIEDSGIGIPEQNMGKVFDPYFTTKQAGSGLGLATSYSIIRNHGGTIEVRSEMNRGSVFTIYLPAAAEDGLAAFAEHAASPAGSRKGRILIMDDERLVREVAREMVMTLGHEVEVASDGEDAVLMFRRAREEGRPFDVVILDLTVKGGMGGEEAVAAIRQTDADAAVVVSSGYADNPVLSNFREHGFSAFLNKPYRIDALRDCLGDLLRKN